MFNVYADSVIGLGVGILIAEICTKLFSNPSLNRVSVFYNSVLLYVLFSALNAFSELNILVISACLVSMALVILWKQRSKFVIYRFLVVGIVIILSFVSSYFIGGIFMPKSLVPHSVFNDEGFNDSGAHAIKITAIKPKYWYLPFVTPGFFLDFGNSDSVFDTITQERSFNKVFMQEQVVNSCPILKSKPMRILYLIEMRLFTAVRILFWPLIGFFSCIVALRCLEKINGVQRFLFDSAGLAFSITAFSFALLVIFLNSDPGRAIFWKWALTRFNELGLFLMMIYTGIFLVKLLDRMRSNRVRLLGFWGLVLILFSGVIVRILFYPSFDG